MVTHTHTHTHVKNNRQNIYRHFSTVSSSFPTASARRSVSQNCAEIVPVAQRPPPRFPFPTPKPESKEASGPLRHKVADTDGRRRGDRYEGRERHGITPGAGGGGTNSSSGAGGRQDRGGGGRGEATQHDKHSKATSHWLGITAPASGAERGMGVVGRPMSKGTDEIPPLPSGVVWTKKFYPKIAKFCPQYQEFSWQSAKRKTLTF